MQKLVWQNSKGDKINLTSGHYGITHWEGFSEADLNVQSQQVPFQDGSVFLDALLSERELTVTLAINDNNNLELRYQLRRELIHNLNPKLGEGYLIYTNDFISKRIKCIANPPIFENHNSNDSGTPKASLAWTACNPYWEDLEENVTVLTSDNNEIITNNGDIECDDIQAIICNIDGVPKCNIKNITTGKEVTISNADFPLFSQVSTMQGNKSYKNLESRINYDSLSCWASYQAITGKDQYIYFTFIQNQKYLCYEYNIKEDLINCIGEVFFHIYICGDVVFRSVGEGATNIYFTSFKNFRKNEGWTLLVDDENSGGAVYGVAYNSTEDYYLFICNNGIYKWDGNTYSNIAELSLWEWAVVYSETYNCFYIYNTNGGTTVYRYDGELTTLTFSDNIYNILVNDSIVLAFGRGRVLDSTDGETFNSVSTTGTFNVPCYSCYLSEKKCYIVVTRSGLFKSYNYKQWVLIGGDHAFGNGFYSDFYKKFYLIEDSSQDKVYQSDTQSLVELDIFDISNFSVKKIIKYKDVKLALTSDGKLYNLDEFTVLYENVLDICVFKDKLYISVNDGGVSTSGIYVTTDLVNFTLVYGSVTYPLHNNIYNIKGFVINEANNSMYIYGHYVVEEISVSVRVFAYTSDGVNYTQIISGISGTIEDCSYYDGEVAVLYYLASSGLNRWEILVATLDNSRYTLSLVTTTTITYTTLSYRGEVALIGSPSGTISIIHNPNRSGNFSIPVIENAQFSGVAIKKIAHYLDVWWIMTNNGLYITNNNLEHFALYSEERNLNLVVEDDKLFVFGYSNGYIDFTEKENLISCVKTDLSLSLQEGDNEFSLDGNVTATVRYRQKYLGV